MWLFGFWLALMYMKKETFSKICVMLYGDIAKWPNKYYREVALSKTPYLH